MSSHKLNPVQAQFVNNANNFQIVQNILLHRKATGGEMIELNFNSDYLI